MIDYKDEILESAPKYRIRDKSGNILFDELTIEQITPVLQDGTEQNQYLFSNINDIESFVILLLSVVTLKIFDKLSVLVISEVFQYANFPANSFASSAE